MNTYKIEGPQGWHTFNGTASECMSHCLSYTGKLKGGTKERLISELEKRGHVVVVTQSKSFTITRSNT